MTFAQSVTSQGFDNTATLEDSSNNMKEIRSSVLTAQPDHPLSFHTLGGSQFHTVYFSVNLQMH